MNLSGKSVQACASFYKIAPKDIIIISDDIDMEFGKVRFRETGSGGGHNGIASIIETLGTHWYQAYQSRHRSPSKYGRCWLGTLKIYKEEKEQLEDVFMEVEKKLLALI
jgi:PTH1 family peptidyl-tRNA hydrolase